MKRIALLLLVAVVGLSGCVKVTSKLDVKNDASAGMTLNFGVKSEAIETIKGFMESAADSGAGEGQIEQAQEAFDEIESMFDEKKMAAKLTEAGVNVKSATSTEKDGWKNMAVVGELKDINAWLAKMRKQSEKGAQDSDLELPFDPANISEMLPNFYKTDKQGVGRAVLIPALAELFDGELPIDPEDLDELGDEELDMIESQIDMMKTMLSLDEMKMEMIVNLPGKILSTKGCKKSGDNGIKFRLSGDSLSLDGMKNLFGLKDGISATFEIPEGCKIQFKDAESTEGGEAEKEKKTEKKGGLKIGGGK